MTDQHHRFSYQFIDSTRFLRPYIPVTLRTGSLTLEPILALVDSGADFSIFDGELSSLLDIDLTKLKTISLAGIQHHALFRSEPASPMSTMRRTGNYLSWVLPVPG